MSSIEQQEPDLQDLLRQARAGSQTAIAEVVKKFSPTVYSVIRRRIARAARTVTDSDDVAQSVWRSFFEGLDRRYLIQSPAQLRALLGTMASNKAIDCGRRHFRRQPVAEQPAAPVGELAQVPSPDPTPSEVLIAKECLSTLTKAVPSRFARVIQMRAAGISVDAIAKELGLPLRSLHRALEQARTRSVE